MSPTIPDVAAFATAPLPVKRAYCLRLPKTSTAAAGLQLPEHFIGIVLSPCGITATVPAPIVKAPSVESNLPSTVQFKPRLRAPGCEIKVPIN